VRVVLDTNIVVSGIVWSGPPFRVLEAARTGAINLATSPALAAELRDVLGRAKFARAVAAGGKSTDELADEYEQNCTVVDPPPLPSPVSADPDDDAVLACAVAAGAAAIVTSDRHLLALGSYQGIPVLTAAGLLARLPPAASGQPPTP
jgi:putative PIN family toxin of toxin-antitoxin system